MDERKVKFSKAVLIPIGILLGFFLLVIIDRFLGFYLDKTGYFKAIDPHHVILYDTHEFTMSADISSQGIRNEMISNPKPKNTYRILAIGDSFTYGWGVNPQDSWVKRLEKSIHIPGKKVEVIDAGVLGLFLNKEIDVCNAYASYMNVDAVIVGLYLGDDLNQELEYKMLVEDKKTIWEKIWPTLANISHPIIAPFDTSSMTLPYHMTISDYWKISSRAFLNQYPDLLDNLDTQLQKEYLNGKINPWLFSKVLASGDDKYYIHILDKAYLSDAIFAYGLAVARLKRECTNNLPTVFIALPSAEQVTDVFYSVRKQFGYTMDNKLIRLDLDTPLEKIISQFGYGYISLLPSFRKDGCPNCYYPVDTHLTGEGNKRVTDIISLPLSEFFQRRLRK